MPDIHAPVDMDDQTNGSLQKNPPAGDAWTGKRRARDTLPKRSILAWLVSNILRYARSTWATFFLGKAC